MRDTGLFIAVISCAGLLTLAGLSIVSLQDYSAIERTVSEFLFVGRIPGTNIFFDFDSFMITMGILALIGLLGSRLRFQVNRRWSREHAEQVGI